jgi:hypothetical protein
MSMKNKIDDTNRADAVAVSCTEQRPFHEAKVIIPIPMKRNEKRTNTDNFLCHEHNHK